MLNLVNKKLARMQTISSCITRNFTLANIDLILSKKSAMSPPTAPQDQAKEREGPKYLKFFRAAEEILYDELVHYDINQTNYYVSRVLTSDFFTFSAKLRNVRILNIFPSVYSGIFKKLVELEGKVHLDIEAFSCINALMMKRNTSYSTLPRTLFYYNRYIMENFNEYGLMRRMDIMIIMGNLTMHNEDAVKAVLSELITKIENKQIFDEMNAYWDYLTLIQFLATYLPTYVQEHEIKHCYKPEFLNQLMKNITTKYGDLRHMAKITEFISELLDNYPIGYVMYQFLRTLFMEK